MQIGWMMRMMWWGVLLMSKRMRMRMTMETMRLSMR